VQSWSYREWESLPDHILSVENKARTALFMETDHKVNIIVVLNPSSYYSKDGNGAKVDHCRITLPKSHFSIGCFEMILSNGMTTRFLQLLHSCPDLIAL
jgi:hypothetical protein